MRGTLAWLIVVNCSSEFTWTRASNIHVSDERLKWQNFISFCVFPEPLFIHYFFLLFMPFSPPVAVQLDQIQNFVNRCKTSAIPASRWFHSIIINSKVFIAIMQCVVFKHDSTKSGKNQRNVSPTGGNSFVHIYESKDEAHIHRKRWCLTLICGRAQTNWIFNGDLIDTLAQIVAWLWWLFDICFMLIQPTFAWLKITLLLPSFAPVLSKENSF